MACIPAPAKKQAGHNLVVGPVVQEKLVQQSRLFPLALPDLPLGSARLAGQHQGRDLSVSTDSQQNSKPGRWQPAKRL